MAERLGVRVESSIQHLHRHDQDALLDRIPRLAAV
jgi:hypothetical protein